MSAAALHDTHLVRPDDNHPVPPPNDVHPGPLNDTHAIPLNDTHPSPTTTAPPSLRSPPFLRILSRHPPISNDTNSPAPHHDYVLTNISPLVIHQLANGEFETISVHELHLLIRGYAKSHKQNEKSNKELAQLKSILAENQRRIAELERRNDVLEQEYDTLLRAVRHALQDRQEAQNAKRLLQEAEMMANGRLVQAECDAWESRTRRMALREGGNGGQ